MGFWKSHWDKIITILFASFALWFSWQANSQSGEALEWQKEQVRKSEKIDIKLDAYLEFENVFLHDFKEVQVLNFTKNPIEELSAWKGFFVYITLDIFNNSYQPITIKKINTEQILFYATHSELSSKSVFKEDIETEQIVPFTLEPKQVEKLYIRVPWLVDSTLMVYLSQIEKNKLFTCKEFFEIYNNVRYPNIKQQKWDIETKGKIALLNLIGKQITNLLSYNTNDIRNFYISVDLANDSTLKVNATYKLI